VAAKNPGKTKSEAITHACEFLAQDAPLELPSIVIAIGPDEFLRRESIEHVLKLAGMDPLGVARFEGEEAQWRDVNDELSTQSLFDTGGPKVAYIRKADTFVSQYREQLERWIEQADAGSTLLMDMQSLPSIQRIYKLAVSKGRLIGTAELKGKELQTWITQWGISKHKVHLTASQAGLLEDRIGYVCGLIDCELAKLALFADAKGKVTSERVDELVGGWRTQTVWKISDAIADGNVAKVMEDVDRLIMAGQTVIGIAAQLSWSLRRYAVAAAWMDQQKRHGQACSMYDALKSAGFNYQTNDHEQRLKKIGWNRAKEMLGWLIELEKSLKGNHSQEDRARIALESFIFRFR